MWKCNAHGWSHLCDDEGVVIAFVVPVVEPGDRRWNAFVTVNGKDIRVAQKDTRKAAEAFACQWLEDARRELLQSAYLVARALDSVS